MADGDAAEYAHDRRQHEHQANHDAGKVDAGHAVQDDEHVGIGQLFHAEEDAGGEQEYEDLRTKGRV